MNSVLKTDLSGLDRPIEDATGLPGACYGDAALRAERDLLFGRQWVPVAVGASLPHPGSQLAVDLAGWPLLMVRGKDRTIRAFFNVCRHRAMRLVDGCASAQVIRCPWHSWAYGLNGRLLATPNVHGPDRQEPLAGRAELGLKQVRCETWLDYVMVDISGKAPPLSQHLAPFLSQIEGFALDRLVHEGRWDHAYPGNWKIAMEGAIEDYHVFWGHPQLMVDGRWRASETWGEVGVYAVTAATVGAGSTQSEPIGLPPIGISGRLTNCVINIFPTAVVGIGPDHMMLGLMLPNGADRTRISFDYYFHPDAMTDGYAAQRAQRRLEWETVAPQDEHYVAGVQANTGIRDLIGIETRFAPAWEGAVRIFQQSVAAVLSSAR